MAADPPTRHCCPILPAAIALAKYTFRPLPGIPDMVLQLSQGLITYGGVIMNSVVNLNFTAISTSSGYDLSSQHPGFTIRPLSFCYSPGSSFSTYALPNTFFSVNSSESLAASLLQVTTTLASSPSPGDVAASWQSAWPPTLVIDQDVTAAAVLQLASSQGGSVSLDMPLLLMGPVAPSQLGVPLQTSVTLDLAGCIGCITLSGNTTHVYLLNLHLTGLEMRVGGNSSGVEGAQLVLPLWAFQFNRSGSLPYVHLRNCSLILSQQEFSTLLGLLGGLPAGSAARAAAAGAQLQVRSGGQGTRRAGGQGSYA